MRIPTTDLVSLCSLSLVGMALRGLEEKINKEMSFPSVSISNPEYQTRVYAEWHKKDVVLSFVLTSRYPSGQAP
jgi:hypothetical protein